MRLSHITEDNSSFVKSGFEADIHVNAEFKGEYDVRIYPPLDDKSS